MVNYQNAVLDRTFAALADPTRRALLARLDEEEGLEILFQDCRTLIAKLVADAGRSRG